MAVHAGLGRRNSRERRRLDRRVAVATIDAVAGDVALVAELNRLLARDARLGDPRRSVHGVEEPAERGDEEDRAEDADPSNRVGAAVKDLRHRRQPRGIGPLVRIPRSTHAGGLYFVKCFTLCQKQAESMAEAVDLLKGKAPAGARRRYGVGAFSYKYDRRFAYFSNHSSSWLALSI